MLSTAHPLDHCAGRLRQCSSLAAASLPPGCSVGLHVPLPRQHAAACSCCGTECSPLFFPALPADNVATICHHAFWSMQAPRLSFNTHLTRAPAYPHAVLLRPRAQRPVLWPSRIVPPAPVVVNFGRSLGCGMEKGRGNKGVSQQLRMSLPVLFSSLLLFPLLSFLPSSPPSPICPSLRPSCLPACLPAAHLC